MIRGRRHRRRGNGAAEELNVTPFMNLMVALVPFLLITLVFTRMAVLDLDLPTASKQTEEPPKELRLEVVVREQGLVVSDGAKRIATIRHTAAGEYDYEALSTLIQRIKQGNPEVTEASVLLEPDTDYDVIIHVMDALRMVRVPAPTGAPKATVDKPLFPQIALGDAP